MSKFGHAIGALAESEEDFDDQSLDYAAELAHPSSGRDDSVAPHIAAAERELETSRRGGGGGGSLDIFDRIAQAAESQFDESRGNTAKRVSELVDDRRVGTKRWTPSKTMKQRMEKLEAARAAATGETAAVAASAPSSSTATMVTPKSEKAAKPEEQADAELMAEEQRAAAAQSAIDNSNKVEASRSVEALAEPEELIDDGADTLRVVPGARGRRRDRARKSRLDEDFEKVFDDDGKPSINSLRRKLRSSASEEAEAGAVENGEAAFGSESGTETKKKGLFSRLLQPKAKKVAEQQVEADFGTEEDDLVEAFETNSQPLVEKPDLGTLEGDELQAAIETKRKQKRIAVPIIGIGAIIGFAGIGWVAYRFLFG